MRRESGVMSAVAAVAAALMLFAAPSASAAVRGSDWLRAAVAEQGGTDVGSVIGRMVEERRAEAGPGHEVSRHESYRMEDESDLDGVWPTDVHGGDAGLLYRQALVDSGTPEKLSDAGEAALPTNESYIDVVFRLPLAQSGMVIESEQQATVDETKAAGIDLDTLFKRLAAAFERRDSEIYVGDMGISYRNWSVLEETVGVYVNAHPDLFYVASDCGGSMGYASDGSIVITRIRPVYASGDIDAMKEEYEKGLAECLSWVPRNGTNMQKAKAVHDWLVRRCIYECDAADTYDTTTYWYAWSAYGAYGTKRKVVCEGYALAYKAACDRLGIPVSTITHFPYAGEAGHEWNRARIDGSWYNVDVCWDDPVDTAARRDGGFYSTPDTDFFLKSDGVWKSKHTPFTKTDKPAATSTKYDNYTFPTYAGADASGGAGGTSSGASQPPRAFSLNRTSVKAFVGNRVQLSLTSIEPSGADVSDAKWSSSSGKASVDSKGLVTAVAPGSATITCSVGDVKASATVSVFGGPLTDSTVSASATGDQSAATSVIKQTVGGETVTLVKGTDYTLGKPYKYGTYLYVDATGIGTYSGSRRIFVTVDQSLRKISRATVSVSSATYTGSALTPTVGVTIGSTTLRNGTDYTLSFANNVDAGTATCVVMGRGSYSGTKVVYFTINPASLSGATVTAAAQTYTGSALTPTPTVTVNGRTLGTSDFTCSYANNVSGPQATMTVTGRGNYTGTAKGTFRISGKSIADATITLPESVAYTGGAVCPDVTVKMGGATLVKDRDYSLTYLDNMRIGTATVRVTGKGAYSGMVSKTFRIVGSSLSSATVSVSYAVFTGSYVEPSVTVSLNGRTLSRGYDYTASYSNNINAGTAKVTVNAVSGSTVSGSKTQSFTIHPASLSAVSAYIPKQTYRGYAVTPTPVAYLGSYSLVKGRDYSVAYSNNDRPTQSAKAVLSPVSGGNFSGSASRTIEFAIEGNDLSAADVTVDGGRVYSGEAQQPAVSVSIGGKRLSSGHDYSVAYSDNVEPGTAYATVKGIGDYTGSKRVPFSIAKFDIRNADAEVGTQAYTGREVRPVPRVTANGTVLRPYDSATGTGDYKCSYTNNVNIGDNATVTITGYGTRYTGQTTRKFSIEQRSLRETSFEWAIVSADTQSSDLIYDGTPKEPKIYVQIEIDGKKTTLTEDVDYTVRYSNNVLPGLATATVTAVSGSAFKGTKSTNFTVSKCQIGNTSIGDIPEQVATGGQIKPKVTVRHGGRTLVEGTDYSLSYGANVSGRGTVTVTGINNYTGSKEIQFDISQPKGAPRTCEDVIGAGSGIGVTISPKSDASMSLGIPSRSTWRGSKLVASKSNDTAWQRITLSYDGSAKGYRMEIVGSGYGLMAMSPSLVAGTAVKQDASPNGTEHWVIAREGDGYAIISQNDDEGKRLALTSNGGKLTLEGASYGKSQLFDIKRCAAVGITNYTKNYVMCTKAGTATRCLAVLGGSRYAGANIMIWNVMSAPSKRFWFSYSKKTGYYTINNTTSGKLAAVPYGAQYAGSNVCQWQRDGSFNQQWTAKRHTDGSFSFINAYSGYAMDVAGAVDRDETNVRQSPYTASPGQCWVMQ